MEETKNTEGDTRRESSPASSPISSPASRARINPLQINNSHSGAHQDASPGKFSYWRSRGTWGRSPDSPKSPNKMKEILIDTAVPFESVKAAANMFGGTADWKAQRALSIERSKNVQQELEKMEQEIPVYQRQSEAAEEANARAVQELGKTKRFVEELRVQLEKARIEEAQAKQDFQLVQLRVKEMEQGIKNEESVAAKAQVNVARTRYLEAVDELKTVKAELDALKKDHEWLTTERETAEKKAKEAMNGLNEVQKNVEELTLELITVKENLELAKTAHLEEEEKTANSAMETGQEKVFWEKQLKQAQGEMISLDEQISMGNDVKLKLETASNLLLSLKEELAGLIEMKMNKGVTIGGEEEKSELELISAKKELEEVKDNIEKGKDRVNCMRMTVLSLNCELDKEANTLAAMKQKEEISTLEAEQQLNKAVDEVELAKISARAMELRLQAIVKEIEAANASEKLALETIKVIEESKEAKDSPKTVIISKEEYIAMSKKTTDAENQANRRIIGAIEQIRDEKKKESRSRERLEDAYKEMKYRKEALRDAKEKAEKAAEGKLKVEQELRDWRTEQEQQRKAMDAADYTLTKNARCCCPRSFDHTSDPQGFSSAVDCLHVNSTPNINRHCSSAEVNTTVLELKYNKRRSFFPRIIMFLARKRAKSLK
ncbi:Protein weak chloroplast movement under blue light 1 [Apostasia shenzhenica]|uniref:Protein weak chloroplast movement under blue light 1 n=1 Tax=Apostasia shenzhenica TaxID=1088818 RepID=A0A2I0AKR7_9ASPA|nr:Protein weak chloroplast movement under blue light 1 [Apostasia shenzhenica]